MKKSTMKNQKFKLEIPLLDTFFWVYVGYKNQKSFKIAISNSSLSKEVKELASKYKTGEYKGCVYVDVSNQVELIHLTEKSSLEHEVLHVIDYISDYYGFNKEKEFRAYLFDYLVKTIKNETKSYF